MTPSEAVDRLQTVLAHLWMIRTFLKHADEVTEDEQLIEIPRLLYDSIRAAEPAYLRKDFPTYLRRLKGKLGKLRKGADLFAREYSRVSAHTNFEMASISLSGAVRQMEEIFSQITGTVETAIEPEEEGGAVGEENA
ncbi:hypothetical protein [Zavarzinella formosa]|uniref:hypothetical protein n=1 Tax=Zavarzinella formosa TaxID=360055 RepID=UPI0002DF92DD|nr:hypothetical protein [Zavarzinella formosa]